MLTTKRNEKTNSVGLGGDGDDVDLMEDFESVFQIKITDKEAENIVILNDAFELICSKLPTDVTHNKKCLTAMAYYRLNKALGNSRKTIPSTEIKVPSDQTPKDFQKHLEQVSQLKLDFATRSSRWVDAIRFLQLISWIAAPVVWSGFAALVGSIALFAATHIVWRLADRADSRVWAYNGTIADLARIASQRNIGTLVSSGGKWGKDDVWRTMVLVIHDMTGYPMNKMKPETNFIV